MKDIICFLTLFYIMLSISSLQGCGKGEDEAQKPATEPAATQTVVEPKADQPVVVEKETVPQETEPIKALEVQSIEQEGREDILAEEDEAVSQTSEPAAQLTEGTPVTKDIIDVITIENQGYTSDKKGPVIFSHLKHNTEYGVSCTQCHHVYKEGENLWKEGDKADKCVVCHDPVEEKDKAAKLQTAFHKNCKDCHADVNKEGKEAPSTKCGGCHG